MRTLTKLLSMTVVASAFVITPALISSPSFDVGVANAGMGAIQALQNSNGKPKNGAKGMGAGPSTNSVTKGIKNGKPKGGTKGMSAGGSSNSVTKGLKNKKKKK